MQPESQKPENPNSEADRRNWVKSLGLFTVILADLLICTGIGVGVGYLAWKKWGAPWWVLMLTSALGLVAAFYRLYQISQLDDQGDST